MFQGKYVKRYFKIDMKNGKFMYGECEDNVDSQPSF